MPDWMVEPIGGGAYRHALGVGGWGWMRGEIVNSSLAVYAVHGGAITVFPADSIRCGQQSG
jgi:hypothetical protein